MCVNSFLSSVHYTPSISKYIQVQEIAFWRVYKLICSKCSFTKIYFAINLSREPSLVDRVLALHSGSRGFDCHWGHMSERFFRSNRPGYRHPVSSELENSGIRVAVGDCSVTEHRGWCPPYQTGKIMHVHGKHYKHNEDRCMAPGVCGNGSVPLSHSGNVIERIGIHTHKSTLIDKIFWPGTKTASAGWSGWEPSVREPQASE